MEEYEDLRLEGVSRLSQQTQSPSSSLKKAPLQSLLDFSLLPPVVFTCFLMVLILFASSPSEISCREDWNLPKYGETHLH